VISSSRKRSSGKVAVRENGRAKKIPKIDLWVRRVIADAIKGSHQASRILIEMRSASDDEIAISLFPFRPISWMTEGMNSTARAEIRSSTEQIEQDQIRRRQWLKTINTSSTRM
jgi:hypothetical protein